MSGTRRHARKAGCFQGATATRRSWDICETTASSPLGRLIEPEHLQPSAKFLMMWRFNDKFEQALSTIDEIKAR